MTADDTMERLAALEEAGEGDSPEAVHRRDQLGEAVRRAFDDVIAPSFRRADGTLPEWIARHRTELPASWEE